RSYWAVSLRRFGGTGCCPSRGLHPRAPLMALLYPTLCRLSSPSDSRAAPRSALLRAVPVGLPRRTPRASYVSALLGCPEMLQTGTATCLDHFPEQLFDLADVDAVAQAYEDAGRPRPLRQNEHCWSFWVTV